MINKIHKFNFGRDFQINIILYNYKDTQTIAINHHKKSNIIAPGEFISVSLFSFDEFVY